MNDHVFRAYDIRGIADRDLTDDFARALGRAFGTVVRRSGGSSMAIGRDARASGPRLRDALVDGITTAGVSVFDVGEVPTPVLYYAGRAWGLAGSLMITGSHNPPDENGFKMEVAGASLHGDGILELRDVIARGAFAEGARGSVTEREAIEPYLSHALGTLRLGDRRPAMAIDAGNGAGGPTALRLYEAMGFTPHALYCEPDGTFPNHHPDPAVEENLADLRAAVAEHGLEVGLALDGDADRIGAVDAKGRILWGDQMMILFGRDILQSTPGATFIADVKCSQSLFDSLRAAGGNPIMWKTGHSLIKAKLRETNAELAGEMSGHMFFNDRYMGFDDGIYAGARLLELLSRSERTLAELFDTLPVMVNTPEIRIECPDAIKFRVVELATERLRGLPDVREVIDVDGARALFEGGWGLVRASNTGPKLVVRCEAESLARLAEIREAVEQAIEAARGDAAA